MIYELYAPNDSFLVDTDKEVDGLARVTDGVGEIGIQVNKTLQLIPAVNGCDGRIALKGAKPV